MRRRALTLVEVLVAVVLMASGIVVVVQGMTAGVRAGGRAESDSKAYLLARSLVSRVHAGEVSFLEPSSGTFEEDDAYEWKLESAATDVEELYEVTLTISWGGRSFALPFLIYNRLKVDSR